MGLIKTAYDASQSVLNDGFKDVFYADSLNDDVLMVKGRKKNKQNPFGEDNNIITNGSIVMVNEGQAMMIVDQGAIVEFSAEAGEFVYDASSEPCLYEGNLFKVLDGAWETFKKRFVAGGVPDKDQRVYYFNLKEIYGNKYGTQNPIPFRIVDKNINLDTDISLRLNGEYSYHIVNPILFYKNVAGNVDHEFNRNEIDSQLKSELLSALQPALAMLSKKELRYSEIPAYNNEICESLNNELSEKWKNTRGIEITSFNINSVTATKEDEERIKSLQQAAALKDKELAAGLTVGANAEAIKDAANNSAGAAAGLFGVNMINNATGVNANDLYAQGSANNTWTCSCGTNNNGNFCTQCGKPRPNNNPNWKCVKCGTENNGNFCTNCGASKPE